MWRRAIPLFVVLVFVVNLLVVGPSSTRRAVASIVGIFAALGVLHLWAQLRPEHWLARLLLTERGPGSNGPTSTRQERFRAARLFTLVGVVALAVTAGVLRVLVITQSSTIQTFGMYLLPFVMFPAAMGIGGGAFLFIRAALTKA